MLNDKNVVIDVYDNMRTISDGVSKKRSLESPIKGRVVISEFDNKNNKKILYEGNNLVTYRGRAYSAMRLFNAQFIDGDNYRNSWKNFNICLFGVGYGGAASNSPLNPISVRPSTVDLTNWGTTYNDNTALNTSSPYYFDSTGRSYKLINPDDIVLLHDDELKVGNIDEYNLLPNTGDDNVFEYSGDNESYAADSFLIVKSTLRLTQVEGNSSDDVQNINEVSMFASDLVCNSNTNILTRKPVLFNKITLPTNVKTNALNWAINWYTFF